VHVGPWALDIGGWYAIGLEDVGEAGDYACGRGACRIERVGRNKVAVGFNDGFAVGVVACSCDCKS